MEGTFLNVPQIGKQQEWPIRRPVETLNYFLNASGPSWNPDAHAYFLRFLRVYIDHMADVKPQEGTFDFEFVKLRRKIENSIIESLQQFGLSLSSVTVRKILEEEAHMGRFYLEYTHGEFSTLPSKRRLQLEPRWVEHIGILKEIKQFALQIIKIGGLNQINIIKGVLGSLLAELKMDGKFSLPDVVHKRLIQFLSRKRELTEKSQELVLPLHTADSTRNLSEINNTLQPEACIFKGKPLQKDHEEILIHISAMIGFYCKYWPEHEKLFLYKHLEVYLEALKRGGVIERKPNWKLCLAPNSGSGPQTLDESREIYVKQFDEACQRDINHAVEYMCLFSELENLCKNHPARNFMDNKSFEEWDPIQLEAGIGNKERFFDEVAAFLFIVKDWPDRFRRHISCLMHNLALGSMLFQGFDFTLLKRRHLFKLIRRVAEADDTLTYIKRF